MPETVLSRYRPEHLGLFSDEERRKFLSGLDPAVIDASSSDPAAWQQVAAALGWELLYRAEPELYQRLVAGEKIHPGILKWLPAEIDAAVEVGAGTGRLTVQLAPRCNWLVAVEPAAPMRRLLQQTLADNKIAGVRVVEGYFDEIPVASGWADLVVTCASLTDSSAHGGMPGLEEMQRVCAPGGLVVIISPAQGGWLTELGYDSISFERQDLEYENPQEAAEIASIFFPQRAEEVALSGSSKIACDLTGCDPPRILYYKRMPETQ